jgi:hypothetical protein
LKVFEVIWFSFPVQLVVNHLKRNHVLLLYWFILFAAITENLGVVLGIPYLFLDPEYLNAVDFKSFMILGIAIGLFTMAFHVTSYIIDGPRFRFLGVLVKPFTKFCVNNSIIPVVFLVLYMQRIYRFQTVNELGSAQDVAILIGGFLSGFFLVTGSLFFYFRATNKDIFLLISDEVNRRIKKSGVARSNILQRLKYDRFVELKIDNYLSENFSWKKIGEEERFFSKHDRAMVTKVFDQNHLNTVTIQIAIFFILLSMGFFRDVPFFQIPAAASVIFLLTFFIIFSGAVAFWFRKWAFSVTLVIFLLLNFAVRSEELFGNYQLFGLDYGLPPKDLTAQAIAGHNSTERYQQDYEQTIRVLENWRRKFPENNKPKMVLLGVSGGGQRAALWAFNSLRVLDSLTDGRFFEHTMLITGASGGMIGSAYYRELILQMKTGESESGDPRRYLKNISDDILNPVILTLVVNDLFVRHQYFSYQGHRYIKDRGYAFERQLNINTDGILDKPLFAYYQPEFNAEIPMMVLSPTTINGGRKLYMSPLNVSYLNFSDWSETNRNAGIDFIRFFDKYGARKVNFLTALRMSATFPYITPNVSLPTIPRVEIMDAGISDNFGIADAVAFLSCFRDWIKENTSGVVILSVRDSEKLGDIEVLERQTMMQKFFNPVKSVYNNWWSLQDIDNENRLLAAREWFGEDLSSYTLSYSQSDYSLPLVAQASGEQSGARRASLNWHLTTLEKRNILSDIYSENNWNTLLALQNALNP